MHKTLGIADEDITLVWVAGKKIFEGGAGAKRIPAVLEPNSALAAPVANIIGTPATIFTAEAKCMLASCIGNVVQELVRHVGRSFEGPTTISTNLIKSAD